MKTRIQIVLQSLVGKPNVKLTFVNTETHANVVNTDFSDDVGNIQCNWTSTSPGADDTVHRELSTNDPHTCKLIRFLINNDIPFRVNHE